MIRDSRLSFIPLEICDPLHPVRIRVPLHDGIHLANTATTEQSSNR